MPNEDIRQDIWDLLKDFQGDEPLKDLFWSKLNYTRVNEPLSRRGWSDTTAAIPLDDPLLLAGGGQDNAFHIIYTRMAKDRLLLTEERQVALKLLNEHPYSLFVFSNSQQDRWHFVNVKYDKDERKRRVFRRITISRSERLRTATERIAMLDLESIQPDMFGLQPMTVQSRHDEAFDVEKVTREFYKEYRTVFEHVEGLIEGFDNSESKRLFTQRLFNRLMFIAFVQKKAWLKLDSQRDYLAALWKAYAHDNSPTTNFYNDRVKLLFFSGLNTPNDVDIIGINRGGFLKTIIGDVPYLNGGLFEEDEDDHKPEIVVPDHCFDSIINNLFNRFNFTVTESTPLDIEVAVDPEMLGKVFEELVTGRHETGSYYTPKPVGSFMCREALKGYLETILPGESPTGIYKFVEEHEPVELRNPEAVLEALRRVKTCDPACGSGAYLLGMLHELLDLRTCLFVARNLDPISSYQRKLEIIQNNLYGVDLDHFAVNIARLRLWLSLAVEFEGMNPPPLPNLDFKIETGDSLTAPSPSIGIQASFRQQKIEDYFRLKGAYMTAHSSEKLTLRDQIAALRAQIVTWTHGGGKVVGFDWPVEFAEVFTGGGFDIMLANPPYVRADAQFRHLENEDERQAAIAKWKDYRAVLLKSGVYQTLYEKWDLYLPFLERAYQLLSANGQMVFIISDAYNTAKYTKKSHEFFLNNARIERIDFCSDIPLFEAGISNTIVHYAKAAPYSGHQPLRVRRWGESCDDFEWNDKVLPTAPQAEFGTAIFRMDSTQLTTVTNCVPLKNVCYLSWGLRPNSDDRYYQGSFTTRDMISDVQDNVHPKPFVQGKDTVKWWAYRIRYLEWGTERAPAMFARPTFPELYDVPEKLLLVKVSGTSPKVVLDNRQLFCTDSFCCCVPWHYLKGVRNKSIRKTARYRNEVKLAETSTVLFREQLEQQSRQFAPKYLLAIVNSAFACEWLATRRRHKIQLYPDDWRKLPIALATAEEQESIISLVDEIIALYNKHGYPLTPEAQSRLQELEQQIDKRVAKLYDG